MFAPDVAFSSQGIASFDLRRRSCRRHCEPVLSLVRELRASPMNVPFGEVAEICSQGYESV
jgi:hypothetical protein